MLPVIAIVGKPNTGKSTLFNRLIGKKKSITFDEAGTTRDRVFEAITVNETRLLMVDTGGLDFSSAKDSIDYDIKRQSLVAIDDADAIMFVVDPTLPLSADDEEVARILRKSGKPILLVATKSDNNLSKENLPSLYELGLGDYVSVSAIHKRGMTEMWSALNSLVEKLPEKDQIEEDDRISISFMGRPNVGKSSLMNAMFEEEKVIVSDVSGTTRDSVELPFDYNDAEYKLIDTAGIPRRGKLRFSRLEKYSVLRSLQSLELADIAVLVMDATEPISRQDLRVSQYILEAKKGLIVVVNKSDLVTPEDKNRIMHYLHKKMQYAPFAPVVFTSAMTGTNVKKILDIAKNIYVERGKKVPTRELNYFMEKISQEHQAGFNVKFKFAEQVDVHPPTFLLFCNKPDEIHFSYRRYIENRIREEYGFEGTAIDIKIKGKRKRRSVEE